MLHLVTVFIKCVRNILKWKDVNSKQSLKEENQEVMSQTGNHRVKYYARPRKYLISNRK